MAGGRQAAVGDHNGGDQKYTTRQPRGRQPEGSHPIKEALTLPTQTGKNRCARVIVPPVAGRACSPRQALWGNFDKRLLTWLRKNLFSPWKICHNLPNPSFRTRPPEAGEIRNPVKVQYNKTLSRSRLASRFTGLGRDDELRHGP